MIGREPERQCARGVHRHGPRVHDAPDARIGLDSHPVGDLAPSHTLEGGDHFLDGRGQSRKREAAIESERVARDFVRGDEAVGHGRGRQHPDASRGWHRADRDLTFQRLADDPAGK
jgi:hypothetical protein